MSERALADDPHEEVDRSRNRERPRAFRSNLPDAALIRMLDTIADAQRKKLGPSEVETLLRQMADRAETNSAPWCLHEAAAYMVLADLSAQGWTLTVARDAIWMRPSSETARAGESPQEAKARLRAPREAARQEQLAEPSVSRFIAKMHQARTFQGRPVSVAHLVDDGADLAAALGKVAAAPEAEQADLLRTVVDPVLEFVTPEGRCAHTGLPLRDIWRYFRHTWSLEYRPTPGRNLQVLIRNAARPSAPVMGVAALTNPILNLEDRDSWIGWRYESVLRRLRSQPEFWPDLKQALIRVLELAQSEIRADDLIESAGLAEGEALERHLAALEQAASQERAEALRSGEGEDRKVSRRTPKDQEGETDWAQASLDPLFRAKRARALAEVLSALRGLQATPDDGSELVHRLHEGDEIERVLRLALRKMRERGLASRILEVNVCGAVAPYRELLGGKLVALMLGASEVREQYRERYRGAASEIASKMAGRAVVRENDVCLLTTTSLYGVGSSQYNRLNMDFGGGRQLRWRMIGETRGFGTIHFRDRTVELLRRLSIGKRGHRHVNNVFGEGTSPLLRQIRDGLNVLRFEANDVLEHSWTRLIYALELYPGAGDDLLLNRASPANLPSVSEIGEAWRRRWLLGRVRQPDILARVAEQGPKTVATDLGASEDPQLRLFEVGPAAAKA